MDASENERACGAWTANRHHVTAKKSILICGPSRGGTSFAASVFLRLGVPFSRGGNKREISSRKHEHKGLRQAFLARDEAGLRTIAEEFASEFDVWAWKLPAIQQNFDLILRAVKNPHLVCIFKDPAAVAFRKSSASGKEIMEGILSSVEAYRRMVTFVETSKVPAFFISYEKATADLPAFLPHAAHFAGVELRAPRAVARRIRDDAANYFSPEPEGDAQREPA
jgi:hypothetical protein